MRGQHTPKVPVRETGRCPHLLLLRLAHLAENPDHPAAVRHFRDESELPFRPFRLARTLAEEELEEPFGDEEQAEVVLLGDLRPLRLDVLEERRKQRCDICVSTRIYTDRKERMEKVTYD